MLSPEPGSGPPGRRHKGFSDRRATSRDQAVDKQHNDGPYDRADQSGTLSGTVPTESLSQEGRHKRADDSENCRQNKAGGLVISRHDELGDDTRHEAYDD